VSSRALRRGAAAIGAAVAAIASANAAHAADPADPASKTGARIDLRAEGCSLDQRELERLVRLELSTVLSPEDTTSLYQVTVACGADATTLRITDPLTEKTLERPLVPPPAAAPEPERLVALAVAQLYRSSWLELLARDRDPPPLSPRERSRAPASVLQRAALAAQQRIGEERRPARGALLVRGGVIARRLGVAPVALAAVALDGRVALRPPLWLGAMVGVEAATLTRPAGDVDVRGVPLAIGVGVEPPVPGPVAFFARLDAGVEYVSLTGRRVAPGLVAGRVDGLGFQGSASAGAALRLRALRLEIAPRIGLLAGTPEGAIAGSKPVGTSGLSAGADVAAGVTF
jgi:hypothetical protein